MNFAELEAFLAVYTTGNYTSAALSLGVSQPAVSRRITLLEADLGTALFERGRFGARATDAGDAFAPFARRSLAEFQAGTRAVQQVQAGVSGSVSLAMAGTIPNTHILERLRRFRAANPDVTLHVTTCTSDDVSDLVATGEVDVGLRYFAANQPPLDSFEVARDAGGVYASNPTNLLDGVHISATELSACPWIMFPVGEGVPGEPFAQLALGALAAAGVFPEKITRIDGLSAQKRLVSADFGLALFQHSAVVDEVANGTMQHIAHDLIGARFPIHMVVRTHRYPNVTRTRLIDALHPPFTEKQTQ